MHTHVPTEAFLTAITAGQKLSTGAQRDAHVHAPTPETPKGMTTPHPAATHAPADPLCFPAPCTKLDPNCSESSHLCPKNHYKMKEQEQLEALLQLLPAPAFYFIYFFFLSFLPRELFAGGREGCLNSSADPFSRVNMQLCKSP